jgi:hypothetical protein
MDRPFHDQNGGHRNYSFYSLSWKEIQDTRFDIRQ